MNTTLEINIEDIDIEKLRNDIISYYGSAMFMVNPIAMMDLQEIQKATDEEVVKKAIELKMDLRKYIEQKIL